MVEKWVAVNKCLKAVLVKKKDYFGLFF